ATQTPSSERQQHRVLASGWSTEVYMRLVLSKFATSGCQRSGGFDLNCSPFFERSMTCARSSRAGPRNGTWSGSNASARSFLSWSASVRRRRGPRCPARLLVARECSLDQGREVDPERLCQVEQHAEGRLIAGQFQLGNVRAVYLGKKCQ